MEHSYQISFPAKKSLQFITHPLHVAIETEDIEDAVCVHLLRVQAIQHDNGRLGVAAILSGRRGRGPITRSIASSTTSSHWWTHAATFISIALIVSMVTASLMTQGREQIVSQAAPLLLDFNLQSGQEC